MKLRIHSDYVGLCSSCRHSSMAKTLNGEFLIKCDYFGPHKTFSCEMEMDIPLRHFLCFQILKVRKEFGSVN